MGQRTFKRLSLACVVSLCLVIATGEWLRLSNSGLGCPRWPACGTSGVLPTLGYHALTDFADRCLVVLVGILIGYAVLGAFRLRPRRKELILASVALGAGYLAQALLGGGVVLSRLGPVLVSLHLLLGLLLVSNAFFLYWLACFELVLQTNKLGIPRLQSQASHGLILAARAMAVAFWLVVALGTLLAGSTPTVGYRPSRYRVSPYASFVIVNARSTGNKSLAAGIPVLLHAASGGALGLLAVGSLVLLYKQKAPVEMRRRLWVATVALLVEGTLGLAAWFSHFQTAISEAHVAVVPILMVLLMNYTLGLERPLPAEHGPFLGASLPKRRAALAQEQSSLLGVSP